MKTVNVETTPVPMPFDPQLAKQLAEKVWRHRRAIAQAYENAAMATLTERHFEEYQSIMLALKMSTGEES